MDAIQREFTLAAIRDRILRTGKMPDVILSNLEIELRHDIITLLAINDERKAENERLQKQAGRGKGLALEVRQLLDRIRFLSDGTAHTVHLALNDAMEAYEEATDERR